MAKLFCGGLGLLLLATALLLQGCATASPGDDPLRPFTTDGCSLFPDRSPVSSADWCHCCVAHDLAYWRGGTAEERLAADRELRTCVTQASGSGWLAGLMHAGVRLGGSPELATSFRWAYGWPVGRRYLPLSQAEASAAAALQSQYEAGNPTLACPRPPGEKGLSESAPD